MKKRALRQPGRSRHRAVVAGVAIVLGSGMAAAVTQPAAIVRHFPPASGLYAAAGIPVNLDRLLISELRGRIVEERGQRYLAVEGVLVNPQREAVAVPPLVLAVRGADGRAIYQWTAPAGTTKLAQGEQSTFRARLAAPPPEGRGITARFAVPRG